MRGALLAEDQHFEALVEQMQIPQSVIPPDVAIQAQMNAQARQDVIEEFGALTSADLADAFGSAAKNRASLGAQWLKAGRVFALPQGRGLLFPRFQFNADGPLPVIAGVLSILKEFNVGPWGTALWFTTATGWLDGQRPVDLLQADPGAVETAARSSYAELVT